MMDAVKFLCNFGGIISQSAPHIYISALPLAPIGSRITQHFLPCFKGTLTPQTAKLSDWPIILNILEGHTDDVISVAFSPDSKRIVSSSNDKTIRVWDMETGRM